MVDHHETGRCAQVVNPTEVGQKIETEVVLKECADGNDLFFLDHHGDFTPELFLIEYRVSELGSQLVNNSL
jgi:hypothetical protein